MANFSIFHILFVVFITSGVAVSATVFNLQNNCPFTVWPGVFSGNGQNLGEGGFELTQGASRQLTLDGPPGWSGRFWPRTGCTFDPSGRGRCVTGDCGGNLRCTGSGATPSTLAEFTIKGDQGKDFYDISLVDGYNVKMNIQPEGGSGDCKSPGCSSDLNQSCPDERFKVMDGGNVVGCKSACEALNQDQYCCRGAFNKPETCPPTEFSKIFKAACPTAYSYAYDDPSSTFTCSNANYKITFCP